MAMTNPFSAGGFDVLSMTMAINKVPDVDRFIGTTERMNLFRPMPVTTTTVAVEESNGVLNLLISQPRGGPAPKNETAKRKLRDFRVPHYPLEDVIRPEEIQGVRSFGSETGVTTEAEVMARKLAEMRRKHDLTAEWLRVQALKGIVLDGDGSTLYNFYTEFGIAQQQMDFDLDDANTDVNYQCRQVVRYIRTSLKGDMATGVHCFCSPDFYDDLIKHGSVKEAFKYFQTQQQLSGDFSGQFKFAGITFEPIESTTTSPDGTTRKFVDDNYAFAFPVGTQSTFMEVLAPADFMETVNTPGLPFYAKQEPMKFNRGTEVHTQMNRLPICVRPEVLVKIGKNID